MILYLKNQKKKKITLIIITPLDLKRTTKNIS